MGEPESQPKHDGWRLHVPGTLRGFFRPVVLHIDYGIILEVDNYSHREKQSSCFAICIPDFDVYVTRY